MKMLTVSLLVCAMMALTRAATLPEAEVGNDQTGAHRIVKRSASSGAWTEFMGRCFHFVAKPMTWAEAEQNCLSMGANLASIHNKYEYQQIQQLILSASSEQKTTWVGGSDAQQDQYWLWTDGSVFQFTNWCPGEPTSQSCLQINYGVDKCWDDVECYFRRPSVCAKKIQFFLG